MYNKDLLVKTFDVIRKEKDEKIKELNEIIAVCLKVGRLEIYRCAEKNCPGMWIDDKYGCGYENDEKGFINCELMGVCYCGEIRCLKHAKVIYDEYDNVKRLLCDTCFEYQKSKN